MDKATEEVALVLKARGLSAKEAHARLNATYRPCTLSEIESLFTGTVKPKAKKKVAPKK